MKVVKVNSDDSGAMSDGRQRDGRWSYETVESISKISARGYVQAFNVIRGRLISGFWAVFVLLAAGRRSRVLLVERYVHIS